MSFHSEILISPISAWIPVTHDFVTIRVQTLKLFWCLVKFCDLSPTLQNNISFKKNLAISILLVCTVIAFRSFGNCYDELLVICYCVTRLYISTSRNSRFHKIVDKKNLIDCPLLSHTTVVSAVNNDLLAICELSRVHSAVVPFNNF